MPNVKVVFKVKPTAGVMGYWIAVGDRDVELIDGEGSIRLAVGRRPFLHWWFSGDPGQSISIVGTSRGNKLVEVKKSTIPPGEEEGSGSRRFGVV